MGLVFGVGGVGPEAGHGGLSILFLDGGLEAGFIVSGGLDVFENYGGEGLEGFFSGIRGCVGVGQGDEGGASCHYMRCVLFGVQGVQTRIRGNDQVEAFEVLRSASR